MRVAWFDVQIVSKFVFPYFDQVAEEATGQGHPATAVQRAIAIMAVRGELQEKNRGFLLYRMR